MDEINEGSSYILRLTYKNELGEAVTPTTAQYQVKDYDTMTIVQAATPFTVTASTYDLVIPATCNTIINTKYKDEVRIITTEATYSGGKVDTEEFEYRVRALYGYPFG